MTPTKKKPPHHLMLMSLLELREANQVPRVTQHTSSRTEMGTQVCLALASCSQLSPLASRWAARWLRGGQRQCGLPWETGPHSEMGLGVVPQVCLHHQLSWLPVLGQTQGSEMSSVGPFP